MPIAVQVPKTPTQLDEVRALMRSFIVWHKERHLEDIHLINAYFGDAAFEEELASLCLASTSRREGSCFWQRWMRRLPVAWPCATLTPIAAR